jgi:hypothetical protein
MTESPRFALRRDNAGWTVFDLATGRPATIVTIPQTGLLEADAKEIARQFNLRSTGAAPDEP